MLKEEFRFFHIDFVPFFNFRIGVGHDDRHVSVTNKSIKILFQKKVGRAAPHWTASLHLNS